MSGGGAGDVQMHVRMGQHAHAKTRSHFRFPRAFSFQCVATTLRCFEHKSMNARWAKAKGGQQKSPGISPRPGLTPLRKLVPVNQEEQTGKVQNFGSWFTTNATVLTQATIQASTKPELRLPFRISGVKRCPENAELSTRPH